MWFQLEIVEEEFQFRDGQIYQLGDIPSAYPYIAGFRFQACAVAFGTKRFSAVACQHDPVLYLVLVLLHHFEESIDAFKVRGAFP